MAQTKRAPHKALTSVWQLDEIDFGQGAPFGLFRRCLQPVPGRKALRFLSDGYTVPDDPRSGADQHHNG